MKKYCYNSPVGKLWIAEKEGKLSHILFEDVLLCEIEKTSVIDSVCKQLDEYFAGERKTFDIPLCIEGTSFQQKVWNALLTVEYGKTATYGDIAKLIGQPEASRAVGGANNKNKIPIIIPCHRIIGKNGTLTGYAGGLDIKQYLLDLESKFVLSLKKHTD